MPSQSKHSRFTRVSQHRGAAPTIRGRRQKLCLALFAVLLWSIPAAAQQSNNSTLKLFETRAYVEAPVVLCIDDKPAAGGQPSSSAYAKAAANGFRSVLTFRAPGDGVDVNRERFMVEQNKMRYFNIPLAGKLPARKQVDEFLSVARDRANHPMLVNCAFAERVAPFTLIFRIKEQGWTEKRAAEEAATADLKKEALEKFARDYFAPGRKKPTG
jgi:protein tyrosine phosphatase (PTP) superfamily phosphohydrolase (DUF442 family)